MLTLRYISLKIVLFSRWIESYLKWSIFLLSCVLLVAVSISLIDDIGTYLLNPLDIWFGNLGYQYSISQPILFILKFLILALPLGAYVKKVSEGEKGLAPLKVLYSKMTWLQLIIGFCTLSAVHFFQNQLRASRKYGQ